MIPIWEEYLLLDLKNIMLGFLKYMIYFFYRNCMWNMTSLLGILMTCEIINTVGLWSLQ